MRASDADRERAATALRDHHQAGRITDEELEDRLATVLTARTLEDLEVPFADLTPPPRPRVEPQVAAPVEVVGYGLKDFRQVHRLGVSRAAAWQQMQTTIVPSMSAYGYSVVDRHEPDYLVFEIQERPAWPWFFIGFLVLFYREAPTRVVVTLSDAGARRTELIVSGVARRPVRRAFAGIRDA